MFASGLIGIEILNNLNTSQETNAAGRYPSTASTSQRLAYSGRDTDRAMNPLATSGPSDILWFKQVILRGRLFDLNRAILVMHYRPDLNWNSEQIHSETRFDELQFAVHVDVEDTGSSLNDQMVFTETLKMFVYASNDAPVIFIEGMTFSKHALTDDGNTNTFVILYHLYCVSHAYYDVHIQHPVS